MRLDNETGNGIAVSLSGDDADELRGYWQKLSTGGKAQMPLEKQVWGDTFDMCTDKFGLPVRGTPPLLGLSDGLRT